ncbi:hypothetical protein X965_04735 [Morganella sp. EGD-HP17]|nr:hypothetical protein X965_04735 [Morganella sp. EGD-HP17]
MLQTLNSKKRSFYRRKKRARRIIHTDRIRFVIITDTIFYINKIDDKSKTIKSAHYSRSRNIFFMINNHIDN